MHIRLSIAVVLWAVPLFLHAAAAAGAAATTVFRGGTLVTMTDQGTLPGDLLVVDGRIDAIGQDLEAPADAVVIDAGGHYLMPGLAEMHAHVPAPDAGTAYRDDVLFLWLAGGITTVRGMLGHPDHLDLKQALERQAVLGPRLVTSGPSFNGDSVASPEQARQMVRDQVQAGYDFLKIHPGLTLPEYDAMADEARRLGIPFAGHVPADVGLRHAIASGQQSVDHLDGFMQALVPDAAAARSGGASLFGVALASQVDMSRLPDLVASLRQAGTWVVPTETLIENFAMADRPALLTARPEYRYLPADLKQRYQAALQQASLGAPAADRALAVRKQIIAALQAGGVGLLLGSDSPQIFNVPGFSIHRELTAMVEAGLSARQALQMGTTAPARFFGRDDFGALRPGMAGDIVLVEGDPGSDIGNAARIRGVMVRGRWLDRAALDAGLAQIEARYADAAPD